MMEVRHISKSYSIQKKGSMPPTLMGRIASLFGGRNASSKQTVHALQDISFSLNQGEFVGILGNNGAGKSTLLKVLSRVTAPDKGEFTIQYPMAALLEIGTGFHPELSGRENIYLMGTLLGMKKRGVDAQLEAIVDFSQTSSYLDTPVKFYSSGMKLRLGFAVAVHLDAGLILLDEVMAAGDMAFQQQCHQKLQQEVKDGKTVLMVSHDLHALKQLSTQALYMRDGQLAALGPSHEVIAEYEGSYQAVQSNDLRNIVRQQGDGSIKCLSVHVSNAAGKSPATGSPLRMDVELYNPFPSASPRVDIRIDSVFGQRLLWLSTSLHGPTPKGVRRLAFEIPQNPLNAGSYFVTLFVQNQGITTDHLVQAIRFEVLPGALFPAGQVISAEQSHLAIPFHVHY
jgi:lipopolysaccharide transport system ATP-binding protein